MRLPIPNLNSSQTIIRLPRCCNVKEWGAYYQLKASMKRLLAVVLEEANIKELKDDNVVIPEVIAKE